MTEKQPKAKSGLRRFAGDMVYSLAGLMILNMTLSFGVYPFLRSRMGAEGSGKMLFFTAIMGLMASAVGSGINYGRMKASTRHETKNGDYNRFLVFTALLCAIVTVVAICVKKDTAGDLPISIGVLIFVTTVRYYADVEYRLSLNYRGFFFYYLFIAVGYAIGMALYGISHSWVSIFILGEMFGLLFVTITGSIFKKPFFKKSQFFREDAKTCVSLSSAYLLSDFVTYTDRVVLPMTAGDAASYYFFIASTVGKMSSLISTPLNGVITGHLARYQGKITKKMLTGVFAALSALAVILIAGTTLGSHIYVYLFYREDYNVVKNLFLLANAGQVFFFMSNTMMTVVLRFAPERYQLIMGVIYAVLFFAAVVPAMYLYKIWGAVWGLLAVNVVKFLLITMLGFLALSKNERKERV